jgi:hypothetical protein
VHAHVSSVSSNGTIFRIVAFPQFRGERVVLKFEFVYFVFNSGVRVRLPGFVPIIAELGYGARMNENEYADKGGNA